MRVSVSCTDFTIFMTLDYYGFFIPSVSFCFVIKTMVHFFYEL